MRTLLCSRAVSALFTLVVSTAFASPPAPATDLAKLYPATLDFFEGQPTREWTCTPDDVWRLDAFRFEYKGLDVELGPSTVVFGVHAKNVVWAAVFPDAPGKLGSKTVDGLEHAESLWMRFHPELVGELFPAKTVRERGPAERIAWAKRLCRWKIASGWQANNLPVIPKKGSIVLDAETVEGPRRYYVAEREQGKVDLVADFAKRALPKPKPLAPASSVRAFDTVWDAFDKEYAKFVLLPQLDWKAAGERWRTRAEQASTNVEAAFALDGLVSELEDLHAWVRCGDEFFQSYARVRPLNASFQAVKNAFGGLQDSKHDFHTARTKDGIGYVCFYKLGDPELPKAFDDALETLADTTALVVDLRFNGGGDELLARAVAARFVERARVYSYSQYRSGAQHDELGPRQPRMVEPRGPWRYEAPIVCLQGQVTFSSAESMALMFAQCAQATTMGDRTGGSSGNPRLIELEGGLKVNLPRWNDLDPDGNAIERVGSAPKIVVEAKPEEFTATKDPVLEKALEYLRKLPKKERKPGKRG